MLRYFKSSLSHEYYVIKMITGYSGGPVVGQWWAKLAVFSVPIIRKIRQPAVPEIKRHLKKREFLKQNMHYLN